MQDTAIIRNSRIRNAVIYSFPKLLIPDQPTEMQIGIRNVVNSGAEPYDAEVSRTVP